MITVFRKEIKYVISLEGYLRLQKQLESLMQRDRYGNHGTYAVRSQYYDSAADQDLHDNLAGVMEKRKIRIRIYSPDDLRPKLEYKCKSGSDGVKHSIAISREEAMMMEEGRFSFLLNHKEELAARLYVKMNQGAYRPRTIVEYDRTAFTYPVSDVRITFDSRIRGSANPYGLFKKAPFYVPLMNTDMGVLEVKYNDFLPSPLKGVVQQIDSLAEASSKYSKARLSCF